MNETDRLITWLASMHLIWSVFVWGYTIHLVASGHSGWWIVLAIALSWTNLYKAWYKRLGIEEDDD